MMTQATASHAIDGTTDRKADVASGFLGQHVLGGISGQTPLKVGSQAGQTKKPLGPLHTGWQSWQLHEPPLILLLTISQSFPRFSKLACCDPLLWPDSHEMDKESGLVS